MVRFFSQVAWTGKAVGRLVQFQSWQRSPIKDNLLETLGQQRDVRVFLSRMKFQWTIFSGSVKPLQVVYVEHQRRNAYSLSVHYSSRRVPSVQLLRTDIEGWSCVPCAAHGHLEKRYSWSQHKASRIFTFKTIRNKGFSVSCQVLVCFEIYDTIHFSTEHFGAEHSRYSIIFNQQKVVLR